MCGVIEKGQAFRCLEGAVFTPDFLPPLTPIHLTVRHVLFFRQFMGSPDSAF